VIDFAALFSQLLASSYWWLLPLFILAALFKSARFKGFIGEVMVNLAARLFLNKNDYLLIKNVTIQLGGDQDYSTTHARDRHMNEIMNNQSLCFNNNNTEVWHRAIKTQTPATCSEAAVDFK